MSEYWYDNSEESSKFHDDGPCSVEGLAVSKALHRMGFFKIPKCYETKLLHNTVR